MNIYIEQCDFVWPRILIALTVFLFDRIVLWLANESTREMIERILSTRTTLARILLNFNISKNYKNWFCGMLSGKQCLSYFDKLEWSPFPKIHFILRYSSRNRISVLFHFKVFSFSVFSRTYSIKLCQY